MPSWLSLLKPVIPALSDAISKVVLHQFTKPKAISASLPEANRAQKQIQELQLASDGNSEAIKVLAQQLENTVKAIEEGLGAAENNASSLSAQVQQLRKLAIASLIVAVSALLCAGLLWARH